jgi:hypothetical protein
MRQTWVMEAAIARGRRLWGETNKHAQRSKERSVALEDAPWIYVQKRGWKVWLRFRLCVATWPAKASSSPCVCGLQASPHLHRRISQSPAIYAEGNASSCPPVALLQRTKCSNVLCVYVCVCVCVHIGYICMCAYVNVCVQCMLCMCAHRHICMCVMHAMHVCP